MLESDGLPLDGYCGQKLLSLISLIRKMERIS